MEIETTPARPPRGSARSANAHSRRFSPRESALEAWPEHAVDACAPEGGVPAWVRMADSSIAEQWAYALEASS